MKKLKTILIIFILILGSYPLTSSAIGQITSPIIISDALPGKAYEKEIIVVGERTATSTIILSASGDIENWVTFYQPEDLNLAISETTLAAGENAKLIAKIDIPIDASLGAHTGSIGVALAQDENEINSESAAYVTQKIDREVNINVSTEEKINFNVSVIPETFDLILNEPLDIRIIYDNQSNLNIAPDIHLKMKNGDNVVYSAIFPYPDNLPETKPGAQYEIKSLQIPTAGLERGKYVVSLDFYTGDILSKQKEFSFSLRTKAEKQSLMASIFSQINWQTPLFLLLGLIFIFALFVMFQKEKKSVPRRRKSKVNVNAKRRKVKS